MIVSTKTDYRPNSFSYGEKVATCAEVQKEWGRAVARSYVTFWPLYPSSGPSGHLLPLGEGSQTEPSHGRH
jgi:hypothetical protein